MNGKTILAAAAKVDQDYHYFTLLNDSLRLKDQGKLSGIVISVKDCICVKGMESTAGSKMLEGYVPLMDATSVSRIKEEGGAILGKTVQDAFGFGSFSVHVGLGHSMPLNPLDKERVCGGSSGGAAGFTKLAPFRHIALAESTGGSIAAPAAYCGVAGFCPTYGRVSRYGLIDYSNSQDKIGCIAKTVEDCAVLLEVIAGHDPKDATSSSIDVDEYTAFLHKKEKMRIGIIREAFGDGVDEGVRQNILRAADSLRKRGHEIDYVSLPLTFSYGVQVYYLLSLTEASTNLAKFCGMRYGYHEELKGDFNDYFSRVRSTAFNKESKRRIILGTFARMAGFRDAYYVKALKVRTLLIEEYKSLFKNYDILISPTMPIVAPRFSDLEKLTPLQHFMADIMTAGPNLSGFPHLSLPFGTSEGMPVGLLMIADHFQEKKLVQLGGQLER